VQFAAGLFHSLAACARSAVWRSLLRVSCTLWHCVGMLLLVWLEYQLQDSG
jgi:hypothetical protein